MKGANPYRHYGLLMTAVASLMLTGCSNMNISGPPPLHTFEPIKSEDFFDRGYIGSPVKATTAYQQHDYTTALHESYGLAYSGNAEAQYLLGLMFAKGEGIPRDPVQAKYWFQESAKNSNAESQYSFAMMLWQGDYLESDPKNALTWFEKSAQQQYAPAQYFLGRLYMTGSEQPALKEPVRQDQAKAFSWLNQAAKNGYGAAQHNLALMYQYGAGTTVDLAQSLFWFQQATRLETPAIAYDFSHFYQIQTSPYRNPERALYWLKKAALSGHAEANREVAALQRQVEMGSHSLVLFGAPVAVQQRDDLRRIFLNQGGVSLSETKDGWFDSYDSKDIWNLSDRLNVGYVLESAKVALIQYRLPQADTPRTLADIRSLLIQRYGVASDRGDRLYSDGIYNEWRVLDTKIVLSKGDNHALFLSYYIEPAYAQMTREQLRHQQVSTQKKAPTNVF